MNMDWRISVGLAGLVISVACTGEAVTVRMDFNISGLPVSNFNPSLTDPVIGSITWEAASLGGAVESFDSISLTLGGHTYSTTEIGYQYPPAVGHYIIGGLSYRIDAIWSRTDDFLIDWNYGSLSPVAFTYACADVAGIWSVQPPGHFNNFSISVIPEPPATVLTALGLLGLAYACKQRRWDRSHSQPTAAPNGGPAKPSENSRVREGPPSVS